MTIDGGLTWTNQDTGGAAYNLLSIHFPNATSNVGYAVGDSGIILKTNDYGITWTDISLDTIDSFDAVFFTDENDGFIVGDSGDIHQTSDGGNTWTTYDITTEEVSINSITFTTTQIGYAVGADGSIFRTDDGGQTWYKDNNSNDKIGKINSNSKPDLNHIFFIDENNGWIVGDNGTIYYTKTGGGGFVNVESETKPIRFILSQNYPNPFNPMTTIEYRIPNDSDVTIQIFDLNGKLINTIVNNFRRNGTYKVNWYGRDSSNNLVGSGIYIYRLRSNSVELSRRMILIK